MVELVSVASREIYAACGFNAALWGGSQAASVREAWRLALFGVLSPLGRLVESELQDTHRPWPVVDAPAADAHCLCLAGERQLVIAVDHRLAPGNPAFVSADSKKSFSNASSPILA